MIYRLALMASTAKHTPTLPLDIQVCNLEKLCQLITASHVRIVRIGAELGRLMLGMGGLTVVYMTGELHPFRGQRFVSV